MRDKMFILGLALASLTLLAIPMAAGLLESPAPARPLSYSMVIGAR